jgi:hypothetical protein
VNEGDAEEPENYQASKSIAHMPAKLVSIAKRILHLLCLGWETVAHVHTAWWLFVDVFRVAFVPALITGLISFWGEHSAAVLTIVFVFTLTACVLLWLAGLGHRSTIPTAGTSGSVLIWGAPPDWQKLRTIWWLWLALGLIGGTGVLALVSGHESPPAPSAPNTSQPPPKAPVPLQPKLYSEAEKEELRNAIRELSKIIDDRGPDIDKHFSDTLNAFPNFRSSNWNPTMINPTLEPLDQLVKSIEALDNLLDGVLATQYRSYSEEIKMVLGITQSNVPGVPQSNPVNGYREGSR